MLRLTLLPVLFWCTAPVVAQGTPKALLWSVRSMGEGPSGYLYGTMHSPDERAYHLVPEVLQAMAEVATVAGELDLAQVTSPKGSMALMAKVTMPEGKRLEDLYSKRQWREVEPVLRDRFGPTAGMMMRMKPFFVMTLMSEAHMSQDRPEMLDAYLMREGRAQGKRVIGLETAAEQLAAVDILSLKEQAALLYANLKDDPAAELDRFHAAYVAQDLDEMMALMRRSAGMPAKFHKAFIADRNSVMAHRMDSVLRVDGSVLALVGAGHLAGNDGLIALLRDRGYSVEPTDLAAWDDTPPSLPPAVLLHGGVRYTHDSLGFAIDLPVMPEDPQVDKDSWMVGAKGEELYVLVAVVHGDHAPPVEELAILNELLNQRFFEGVQPVERPVEVGGRQGRRTVLENGERYMEVLSVARDRRLYVAIAATTSGQREQVALAIDSFRAGRAEQ